MILLKMAGILIIFQTLWIIIICRTLWVEGGLNYIGETGWSLKVRLKEHGADICNQRVCTSALAEHSEKSKHHICLEDSSLLAKENHYFKRRFREALEIIKHHNNHNRDGGFEVSKNWVPLIKCQNKSELSRF